MAETSERFASNTDHDIATMLEDKDSSSTKKATKQAIKVLREYCAENGLSTQFEDNNKVELDNLLKQFFAKLIFFTKLIKYFMYFRIKLALLFRFFDSWYTV